MLMRQPIIGTCSWMCAASDMAITDEGTTAFDDFKVSSWMTHDEPAVVANLVFQLHLLYHMLSIDV